MIDRPHWDPYDVIVQLDLKCQMQGQQIHDLMQAQQLQAQTIGNLIKSMGTLQQAHLQLSELVTEALTAAK
jgi:hypothetical protein